MTPHDNLQQFVDRAKEHGLDISVADAADLGCFSENVASIYEAIRGIDTTGFEPAAIFVPTQSKREAE